MFLNVSPDVGSTDETLSSLRFGLTVNGCHIGTARKDAGTAE